MRVGLKKFKLKIVVKMKYFGGLTWQPPYHRNADTQHSDG